MNFRFLTSYYLFVILSFCHFVILSFCHFVFLSFKKGSVISELRSYQQHIFLPLRIIVLDLVKECVISELPFYNEQIFLLSAIIVLFPKTLRKSLCPLSCLTIRSRFILCLKLFSQALRKSVCSKLPYYHEQIRLQPEIIVLFPQTLRKSLCSNLPLSSPTY